MPMQAESLEVLERADVAPAQARAIVRAIEIEITGAKDTLATKHDLLLQSQDLHRQSQDLRRNMTELEASLRAEITKLDASVREQVADLRTDMADWRGELRAEIQATASSGTRQMYMALLGQMAVLLGFAYFFATHIR